jgi:hypothetical protein
MSDATYPLEYAVWDLVWLKTDNIVFEPVVDQLCCKIRTITNEETRCRVWNTVWDRVKDATVHHLYHPNPYFPALEQVLALIQAQVREG